jgi:hypothetical protein
MEIRTITLVLLTIGLLTTLPSVLAAPTEIGPVGTTCVDVDYTNTPPVAIYECERTGWLPPAP